MYQGGGSNLEVHSEVLGVCEASDLRLVIHILQHFFFEIIKLYLCLWRYAGLKDCSLLAEAYYLLLIYLQA